MRDPALASSAGSGAGAERRAHSRRPLRNKAILLLSGGRTVEVRTFDISLGGIGVLLDIDPPQGAAFGIRVSLPLKARGYETLQTRVKVMHSVYGSAEGGFKVGLRFLELDGRSAQAVASYTS